MSSRTSPAEPGSWVGSMDPPLGDYSASSSLMPVGGIGFQRAGPEPDRSLREPEGPRRQGHLRAVPLRREAAPPRAGESGLQGRRGQRDGSPARRQRDQPARDQAGGRGLGGPRPRPPPAGGGRR